MSGVVVIPMPDGWEGIDGRSSWDYETPTGDLAYALSGEFRVTTYNVDADAVETDPITLLNVESVEVAYAAYHGEGRWTPGDRCGTELTLYALLCLRDGRWASIDAWNDYTGWGCQDGVDVRIAATRERVISHGMTDDIRAALGLAVTP